MSQSLSAPHLIDNFSFSDRPQTLIRLQYCALQAVPVAISHTHRLQVLLAYPIVRSYAAASGGSPPCRSAVFDSSSDCTRYSRSWQYVVASDMGLTFGSLVGGLGCLDCALPNPHRPIVQVGFLYLALSRSKAVIHYFMRRSPIIITTLSFLSANRFILLSHANLCFLSPISLALHFGDLSNLCFLSISLFESFPVPPLALLHDHHNKSHALSTGSHLTSHSLVSSNIT